MPKRIKVRTPRGPYSILTMSQSEVDDLISAGGGGSVVPYKEEAALTADVSKLFTHDKGKKASDAFYYDDGGWAQKLKVNNENTGNDLNAAWVYSGKEVLLRTIYINFTS